MTREGGTGQVEAARVGGRAQVPCTRFTLVVGMPGLVP